MSRAGRVEPAGAVSRQDSLKYLQCPITRHSQAELLSVTPLDENPPLGECPSMLILGHSRVTVSRPGTTPYFGRTDNARLS